MNAIVWGRNITLDKDNVVYKKATQFQVDKKGLGRLILTDLNEIKDLITNIDHTNKRGENQLSQQQEQNHSY
jgi:hypothetical protein